MLKIHVYLLLYSIYYHTNLWLWDSSTNFCYGKTFWFTKCMTLAVRVNVLILRRVYVLAIQAQGVFPLTGFLCSRYSMCFDPYLSLHPHTSLEHDDIDLCLSNRCFKRIDYQFESDMNNENTVAKEEIARKRVLVLFSTMFSKFHQMQTAKICR